jgi:hypothetical protein
MEGRSCVVVGGRGAVLLTRLYAKVLLETDLVQIDNLSHRRDMFLYS